jgi:hypothetical protein
MIVHILLGKERAGLTDDERQELREAISRLRDVPGVQQFSAGPNFSERSQGYQQAAVMYFSDRDALDGYLKHEQHLAVVDILNRLLPERLIADYEAE